jgi:hypothetical protein
VNALIDYEWPASVQENIDGLITTASAEASRFDQYAKSFSIEDWPTSDWPSSEDAAIVRAKLGLPTNIDSDVQHCQEIFGVLG